MRAKIQIALAGFAVAALAWTGLAGAVSPEKAPSEKVQLWAGAYGVFDEVVFATRSAGTDPHWYANISYYCKSTNASVYSKEGRLLAYNLKTGKFRTLLADKAGGVRDPCVHYDGRTILLSYRPGGTGAYHLYTINADGSNLRQLTFGEYDDFEPAWLPDGDIVFVSTRCRRWVNCWMTQVATIFRMKPDGSGIRMLSANTEHDNTPWVLPGGRSGQGRGTQEMLHLPRHARHGWRRHDSLPRQERSTQWPRGAVFEPRHLQPVASREIALTESAAGEGGRRPWPLHERRGEGRV